MKPYTVVLHPNDIHRCTDYIVGVLDIRQKPDSKFLMLMHEENRFTMVNPDSYRMITQEVAGEQKS